MGGWRNKELWKCAVRDGDVEVVHWTRPEVGDWSVMSGEGPHRWNIYAIIREKHPLFARLTEDRLAKWDLPMHGGATFHDEIETRNAFGTHRALKIGCGYHRLGDERFTHMATAGDAREVFEEADRLARYLEYAWDELKENHDARRTD